MLKTTVAIILFNALFCVTASAEIYRGEVSYKNTRSVYVKIDAKNIPSSGDSVYAGADSLKMRQVAVKSSSETTIVLAMGESISDVSKGSPVFVKLNNRENGSSDGKGNHLSSAVLKGSASMQYFHSSQKKGNFSFDQPSFFMDTSISGFSSLPLTLNLRFRSRLEKDSGGQDGSTSKTMNRFYDISLEYGGRNSQNYLAIGKVRTISGGGGIGGIDGLVMERNIAKNLRGGFFAGVTPETDEFLGDSKALKRGAYIRYLNNRNGKNSETAVISYIGENNPNNPTAHILLFSGTLKRGKILFISQDAAFNAVRSDTGMESKTVRNLRTYISTSPLDFFTAGLSYTAYIIPVIRSYNVDTDPMDELRYNLRHTVSPRIRITPGKGLNADFETLLGKDNTGNFGVNSFAVRGGASNLLNSGLSVQVSQTETRQDDRKGHHTNVYLSRRIISSVSLNVSGGYAEYRFPTGLKYSNKRGRIGGFANIGKNYYLSFLYSDSWGKNPDSRTFFAEMGKMLR